MGGKMKNKKLISFVMMSKENESDSLGLFIDNEFEDKTLHNMNPSFSGKCVFQGFVMRGIENNLINFKNDNLLRSSICL